MTANIKVAKPDHTLYHAVQVAACNKREKVTTLQMRGHFKKAGVPPKRFVKEFPVSADAHVPIGALHCVLSFGFSAQHGV